MHLTTVEAIRRASQGQALAVAVSYSLRYYKNSSQLTPTQNLGLWKSIVLPHFLQNLRYIHSDTDIKKKCKLVSICPWHESSMYMVTTQDSWQTQESLPFNSRDTFTSPNYTFDSPSLDPTLFLHFSLRD